MRVDTCGSALSSLAASRSSTSATFAAARPAACVVERSAVDRLVQRQFGDQRVAVMQRRTEIASHRSYGLLRLGVAWIGWRDPGRRLRRVVRLGDALL